MTALTTDVSIGPCGGRYFRWNNDWVPMRVLADYFRALYAAEGADKNEAVELAKRIENLDYEADQMLAEESLLIRVSTAVMSCFGNWLDPDWRKKLAVPTFVKEKMGQDGLCSLQAKVNLLRFYKYSTDLTPDSILDQIAAIDRENLYAPPTPKPPLELYLKYCQEAESQAEFLYLCAVGSNNVKFIKKMFLNSIDSVPAEEAEKHIVRRDTFAKAYEYGDDQLTYGKAMESAIDTTYKLRKFQFQTWDFDLTLKTLSYLRSLIATLMDTAQSQFFGIPEEIPTTHLFSMESDEYYRNDPSRTPVRSHYAFLGPYFEEALQQELPGFREVPIEQLNAPDDVKKYLKKAIGLFVKLGEETINIATIVYFQHDRWEDLVDLDTLPASEQKLLKFWTGGEPSPIMLHTLPCHIPKIKNLVRNLYTQALQSQDKSKIIQLCASIFWWLCVCKFVLRGDPSIAEKLFKCIFRLKKIPISAWKEDLIPWCEVITRTPQEFAKDFPSFFEVLP